MEFLGYSLGQKWSFIGGLKVVKLLYFLGWRKKKLSWVEEEVTALEELRKGRLLLKFLMKEAIGVDLKMRFFGCSFQRGPLLFFVLPPFFVSSPTLRLSILCRCDCVSLCMKKNLGKKEKFNPKATWAPLKECSVRESSCRQIDKVC